MRADNRWVARLAEGNRFQLDDDAVAAYERQKVRSIFRPLAEATIDRLGEPPKSAVLDVACGTGIVARVLRDRFGSNLPITGVDISEGMIGAARSFCAGLAGPFDWHVAPVHDMPLGSRSFGVCFCQQGMQYFPDDHAALREMNRVLRVGGLLVLTVWSGPNDYFRAMAAAMERYVSEEAAAKTLAPFAYDAPGRLPPMLGDTGFVDLDMNDVVITRVIPDAERGIVEDIEGSPLAPLVGAGGPRAMQNVVASVLDACGKLLDGGDIRVPQRTHMVTARAA
jgi:SAM-dependent methyltransferase